MAPLSVCTARSAMQGPASFLNAGELRIVPSAGSTLHSVVNPGRKTLLDGTIDRSGHRGSFNYLDGDP